MHEKECVHPRRSGAEVMDALQILDQQKADEKKLFEYIFILLDYEKITFNGALLARWLRVFLVAESLQTFS